MFRRWTLEDVKKGIEAGCLVIVHSVFGICFGQDYLVSVVAPEAESVCRCSKEVVLTGHGSRSASVIWIPSFSYLARTREWERVLIGHHQRFFVRFENMFLS